MIDLYIRSPD